MSSRKLPRIAPTLSLNKLKIEKFILPALLLVLLAAVAYANFNNTSSVKTDSGSLVEKWLIDCKNEDCLKEGLEAITAKHGTSTAMQSLNYYIHKVPNSLKGDDHLRAHHIGRQAAVSFGMTGKSFLECPPEFNYGCMHGFFEKVLADAMTPEEAADSICSSVESSSNYSSNHKYYCYHGIGHGVMMAYAYDLPGSLAACDKLASQLAQTGCWQGVFMENVNGQMNGGARKNVFSQTNPLAPCDSVAEKYQRECYINHHGYLFSFYHWDLEKSAKACLSAGTFVSTCLEGMGLAATSDVWQKILLGSKMTNSAEANGWEMCQKFPDGYIANCVTGAVIQILQMDRFELQRANKFCSIAVSYQTICYQRIGEYLRLEAVDAQKAADYCNQLPSAWQNVCEQGAKSQSSAA